MIFDWPGILVPADIEVKPPRQTVGLNTSITNFTQSVPAIRPPFGMSLEFSVLSGDKVLAWRALMALFEGRANRVRIPLFDFWYRASDAAIGAGRVSFSDGSPFADGALWETSDIAGVTVDAVQGQRTFSVDFGEYGPGLLQAGMYFGIGEHPYIARRVWWEGNVAAIESQPTMRRVYSGEELRLRPVMIAGLVDDDAGALKLRRGRHGGPSLELVERLD